MIFLLGLYPQGQGNNLAINMIQAVRYKSLEIRLFSGSNYGIIPIQLVITQYRTNFEYPI